jgi:hypothetical protein
MIPSAYTSVRGDTCPSNISGAMYAGVPAHEIGRTSSMLRR